MADETQQPLIEIPDDDDLSQIVQGVMSGQHGTMTDEGDLPWGVGNDTDDSSEAGTRYEKVQSPIRGAVSYLSFGIPMDCYLAFSAWDERESAQVTGTPNEATWQAVPERDKMVQWFREMVGRDLEADENRTPDERHYYFGGLFKGLTYKKLVIDTHMRGSTAQWKKQLRLVRAQERIRFRDRMGPEWTDEAIDDVLGPLPDDE